MTFGGTHSREGPEKGMESPQHAALAPDDEPQQVERHISSVSEYMPALSTILLAAPLTRADWRATAESTIDKPRRTTTIGGAGGGAGGGDCGAGGGAGRWASSGWDETQGGRAAHVLRRQVTVQHVHLMDVLERARQL